MELEVEKSAQKHAKMYLSKVNSAATSIATSPLVVPLESPMEVTPLVVAGGDEETDDGDGNSIRCMEGLIALYKVLLLPEDALSMYVQS
jgi:hypothetical protein